MNSMSLSDRRGAKPQPSKLFRMDYLPSLPMKSAPKEKALMHASNKKIFIGPNYQAELPALQSTPADHYYQHVHRRHEIPLWKPTDTITPEKLTALLAELKSKGFDEDQVLAFLLFQEYKVDATLAALQHDYVGKQEGMPLHDKVLFVQGYGFHGKNFERIRDLVPNHSIQTLINHYYTEFKRNKANNKLQTTTRTETEVRKLSNAQLMTDPKAPLAAAVKAVGRPRILRDAANSAAVSTEIPEESTEGMLFLRARQGEAMDDEMAGLDETDEMDESWEGQERRLEQQLEEERQKMAQLDEQLAQLEQEEGLKEEKKQRETYQDELLQDDTLGQARTEVTKEPTLLWHAEELKMFMRSLVEYGKDFGRASRLLPNKTEQQVRNMFYNRGHFYGLEKLIQFHDEKEAMAASKKSA
ncbi:REST corepressor 1-like isoform X2 [Paramacrobiotus metropolitanus]|nr:REST corepressor 1-like isoform X2 [Paramacrobiotus metropolitanus]XP_055345713.1 REST corepressor 1-like isoform X2 [Paramacrobiotus metropolitanus]